MNWQKLGVVFRPTGERTWARSHATCPTPLLLGDKIRIYIQCRDASNVGRIGFVDVDARDPTRVVRVHDDPVLDIGVPGSFDENGVFQTCVLRARDGSLLLYYVGFELGTKIRYRLLTGLAVSRDGGISFERVQRTPILERSDRELYFRCGPFVLEEQDVYRMWYVAGSEWQSVHGKQLPRYDIRYAESTDGVNWPPKGAPCLELTDPDEVGFGRPYVAPRPNGGYRMFHSIRKRSTGGQYRLGYAESPDGRSWTRKDAELGLDVSPSGWDSEAIDYSAVVTVNGRTWLFYNGNDYGATGFGVALLREP